MPFAVYLSYCDFGGKLIFRFGGKGLGEGNDVKGEMMKLMGT